MKLLLFILLSILIVGLFYYSKLTPHKARLTGKHLQFFNTCERFFTPVLRLLQNIARPMQVGNGIAVDMAQMLLLVLLLLLIKIFA